MIGKYSALLLVCLQQLPVRIVAISQGDNPQRTGSCFVERSARTWICSASEGDALNLEQALAASCHHLACRQIGDRRVIVDGGRQLLTIQVQRRSKRHWVTDDHGGGVRYLAGVLRDGAGSYVCLSNDLTNIAQVRTWLPAHHQALLLPDCDDWQVMEQGDV